MRSSSSWGRSSFPWSSECQLWKQRVVEQTAGAASSRTQLVLRVPDATSARRAMAGICISFAALASPRATTVAAWNSKLQVPARIPLSTGVR